MRGMGILFRLNYSDALAPMRATARQRGAGAGSRRPDDT
jgi:hypothetical protein